MSRARELARLGNENIASVDSTNERLGIGSEQPAKKLDVGGDLQVTGTTASTSTTTGAVTVSGGVGIAKSLFVGEGVSIAGTITYNDVTNIDSVGFVTAGKGLRATTGGLIVSAGVSTIGGKLSVSGITSVGDVVSSGIITADSYYGDAANMTNAGISAGKAMGLAAFLS